MSVSKKILGKVQETRTSVTGEEVLPIAVELAKAGKDNRADVRAALRAAFGERDDRGLEVDYGPDARQVLAVLLPKSQSETLRGGRMVGYPRELEQAVFRALKTATEENGYEVNPDLMVEATELMDLDADVERLARAAKPSPSVAMIAAMVAKWQLQRGT